MACMTLHSLGNCLQITSLRGYPSPLGIPQIRPFHQYKLTDRHHGNCMKAGKRADVFESLTLLRFPDATADVRTDPH